MEAAGDGRGGGGGRRADEDLKTRTPHNDVGNYITINYTTAKPQLQLHYTTQHPAVVGEVTNATMATTPKKQHNSNHLSVH